MPENVANRESVLEEAYRLTHGPRQADYGHPLDDYTRTAALINALFAHKIRIPLDAEDAAQIQMLVKLSRHQNVRKRDNMVDGAGYAWVTWACTEERERRAAQLPDPEDYGMDAASGPDSTVIAPVGTGPLIPMELNPLLRGRLLPCGCFGSCPYVDGPHPPMQGATMTPKPSGPKDPRGNPYRSYPGPLLPAESSHEGPVIDSRP